MRIRLLTTWLFFVVLSLGWLASACVPQDPPSPEPALTPTPRSRNLLPATWTPAPTQPPTPTRVPTERATSSPFPTSTATPVISGTLEVVQTLTAAAPTRTPGLLGLPTSWVRMPSPLLGVSIAYPDLLTPVESGGGLTLVSAAANLTPEGERILPLTVTFLPGSVSVPAAPPLPPAEDYGDVRDLVEAMILDLEENERLLLVREEVDTRRLGGDRAAEALVEAEIMGPDGPEAMLFYLAAVVHEDRLILMSAGSPLSVEEEFLPIARSIFGSIEF